MATLQQITEGLARACGEIRGLRCYPELHPKPEPPALCVSGPIRWTYDETMDGTWHPVFELWLFVNPANLPLAHQALFAYLAPMGRTSIPAAIHGDPTLGAVVHDTRVLGGARPAGLVEVAGGSLLSVALEVEVWAMAP